MLHKVQVVTTVSTLASSPQEQGDENANYRVDHPRVEEGSLQFESKYRATGDEA